MSSNIERRIVVCTVIACALGWSLPAAAADSSDPVASDARVFGITGRVLNEAEMTDIRGRGSRVDIRVNGVDHSDSNPNTPGSSSLTVNLGGGAVARGFASTSGNGTSSARVSINISGVTFRTSGN